MELGHQSQGWGVLPCPVSTGTPGLQEGLFERCRWCTGWRTCPDSWLPSSPSPLHPGSAEEAGGRMVNQRKECTRQGTRPTEAVGARKPVATAGAQLGVMSWPPSCILHLDGSRPAPSHPREQRRAVPALCPQVSGETFGLNHIRAGGCCSASHTESPRSGLRGQAACNPRSWKW